ncbi:MAG: formylglycine-generating enzyme family protein, partial [Candidatus Entotheonellia bacterium]
MLTKYLLGAGQRGEYYQKALELRSLVEEPVKRWEEAKRNAPRIKDSIAMVGVPAGCFMMGGEYEKPVHRVCLAGFEIQKTEATAAQYMACVAIGACTEPDSDSERKCNWKRAGRENHPISCVDWDQGRTFCTSIGGRLPTEAEWEYAARGTDGRKYPWGNQEVDGNRANFCDVNCKYDWRERAANDGYRETAPVGSFPRGASPFGALDMAGNVSEWVADWHDDTYYQRSPEDNPRGPVSGSKRVERGGGWYGGA